VLGKSPKLGQQPKLAQPKFWLRVNYGWTILAGLMARPFFDWAKNGCGWPSQMGFYPTLIKTRTDRPKIAVKMSKENVDQFDFVFLFFF
jgi:hypothetical protein